MKYRLISLFLAFVAIVSSVSCNKDIPATSINLSLPPISSEGYVELMLGSVFEAKADVVPAKSKDVLSWIVVHDDIAMVAYNESDPYHHSVVIVGLKVGSTEIVVNNSNGVEAHFYLLVKQPTIPLESIILNVDEITIPENGSVAIGYSFYPEDANDFYGCDWTISDEKVVEYSWEEGGEYLVDAVAPGTATVTCSVGEISASCIIHVVSSYVPVASISSSISSVTTNRYDFFEVPIVVAPSNATTKGFNFEIEDTEIISFEGVYGMTGHFVAKKEGTTKVTVISRDQEAGKSSTFTVKVNGPRVPQGTVDMGFRSAKGEPVFFRKANLGSDAEVDAGFLYAWGNPTPYYYSKNPYTFRESYENGYTLENDKWYDSVSKKYTRYVNNGEVLAPEDDPVHKSLGGKWYTPDINELAFLYNFCDRKEEVRSGVHGMTFTSRLEGFEGTSLFLPCGGYMVGKDNFADGNFEDWKGNHIYMGCYQSRNVYYNDPEGFYGFVFYDGKVYVRREARYLGESIRPVWRGPAL